MIAYTLLYTSGGNIVGSDVGVLSCSVMRLRLKSG